MKYYIILNSNSLTQYGITHKLQLAYLFILERRNYLNNLTLKEEKSNDMTKDKLKSNQKFIHYFSDLDVVLTTEEKEVYDYIINSYVGDKSLLKSYRKRYAKKKFSKELLVKLDEYEEVVIPQTKENIITSIISNSGIIEDFKQEKSCFENIRGW